eukprot:332067-Amphidinium_carterae.2
MCCVWFVLGMCCQARQHLQSSSKPANDSTGRKDLATGCKVVFVLRSHWWWSTGGTQSLVKVCVCVCVCVCAVVVHASWVPFPQLSQHRPLEHGAENPLLWCQGAPKCSLPLYYTGHGEFLSNDLRYIVWSSLLQLAQDCYSCDDGCSTKF